MCRINSLSKVTFSEFMRIIQNFLYVWFMREHFI